MESDITLDDDIGYSKTGVERQPKYATYKWNFGDELAEVTGVAPGAPSLNSPETSPCDVPWKAPVRCEHVPLLSVRRHLQRDANSQRRRWQHRQA